MLFSVCLSDESLENAGLYAALFQEIFFHQGMSRILNLHLWQKKFRQSGEMPESQLIVSHGEGGPHIITADLSP